MPKKSAQTENKRNITIRGDVKHSTIITGDEHLYGRLKTGVPFQAPPLPSHYIERPEVSVPIKDYLLSKKHRTLAITAVFGLGGIGKSILATALAHDTEIQKCYSGGILWATLGQNPDLLSLLHGWIQALADYAYRPTTIEAATSHLRSLLHNRAALLIVDDVWFAGHAKPFLVGGEKCQVIVTTRRADIGDEVGAEIHQIDVMNPDQAVALLAARIKYELSGKELSDAKRFAHSAGYLPQALELGAIRIIKGKSWEELCQALDEEIAKLEILEISPQRRRKNLTLIEASFNLSIEALRHEDEKAWSAFLWLGILPEDVVIYAPMASTLWNTTLEEAEDILELLWNDALLLPGSPKLIENQEWKGYRLHDLLHDVARRSMGKSPPEGYGLTIQEANSIFLDHYKKRKKNNLWHTLPNDGYVHSHLTWHMEEAGKIDMIHELLSEESVELNNGWYQACERVGQIASYLADLSRGWKAATKDQIAQIKERSLGMQCRYALIRASLNSSAKDIPKELLIALVKSGIWPIAQAITYAIRISNPHHRVEAIVKLTDNTPDYVRNSAFREIVTLIQRSQDDFEKAVMIRELLPILPSSMLREILPDIRRVRGLDNQVAIQIGCVNRLALVGKFNDAVPIIQLLPDIDISGRNPKADAIVEALPFLSLPLIRNLLHGNYKIPITNQIKTAIAVRLAETGQLENSMSLMFETGEINEHWVRSMEKIVKFLSVNDVHKCLSFITTAKSSRRDREEAKSVLFPRLAEHGFITESLKLTQNIKYEIFRNRSLASIIQVADTIGSSINIDAEIASISDKRLRALALIDMISHTEVHKKNKIIEEAQSIARTIDDKHSRAELLTRISEMSPESMQRKILLEALESSRMIDDQDDITSTIGKLSAHVSENLLYETIKMIQELPIPSFKAQNVIVQTMAWIVPYLPDRLIPNALEVANSISTPRLRDQVIVDLVPRLAKSFTIDETLSSIKTIESRRLYALALVNFTPYLPKGLRNGALSKALSIVNRLEEYDEFGFSVRMRALNTLVSKIVDLGLEDEIPETAMEKDYIKLIQNNRQLLASKEYGNIVNQTIMNDDKQKEALQRAKDAPEHVSVADSPRTDELAKIAPYLSETNLREAIDIAKSMKRAVFRSEALVHLLPRLAAFGYFKEAILEAQNLLYYPDVADGAYRRVALSSIISQISKEKSETIISLWQELIELFSSRTRSELLFFISEYVSALSKLDQNETIEEIYRSIHDVSRWWQ